MLLDVARKVYCIQIYVYNFEENVSHYSADIIVPYMDFESYNISVKSYLKYNVEQNLKEIKTSKNYYQTQFSERLNSVANDKAYTYSRNNIILTDECFVWLNFLPSFRGDKLNFHVFLLRASNDYLNKEFFTNVYLSNESVLIFYIMENGTWRAPSSKQHWDSNKPFGLCKKEIVGLQFPPAISTTTENVKTSTIFPSENIPSTTEEAIDIKIITSLLETTTSSSTLTSNIAEINISTDAKETLTSSNVSLSTDISLASHSSRLTASTSSLDSSSSYLGQTYVDSNDKILWYIFGSGFLLIIAAVVFFVYCRRYQAENAFVHEIMRHQSFSTVSSKTPTLEFGDPLYLDRNLLQINYNEIYGKGISSSVFQGKIKGEAPLFKMEKTISNSRFQNCVCVVKIPNLNSEEEIEALNAEIRAAKILGSQPNICALLGWSIEREIKCLIFEPMKQDLESYLKSLRVNLKSKNNKNSVLTTEKSFMVQNFGKYQRKIFLQLIWQATKAFNFIASKNVIHRDIAARNFLLSKVSKKDETMVLKIADFGLSCFCNQNTNVYKSFSSKHLPVKWLSIEALTDQMFSEASDVWAFGITLIEIYSCAAELYPGIQGCEIKTLLESGKRMKKPEQMSDEMYKIAINCWHKNPLKRPKFKDLDHMFYQMLIQTDPNYYYELIKDVYGNYLSIHEDI